MRRVSSTARGMALRPEIASLGPSAELWEGRWAAASAGSRAALRACSAFLNQTTGPITGATTITDTTHIRTIGPRGMRALLAGLVIDRRCSGDPPSPPEIHGLKSAIIIRPSNAIAAIALVSSAKVFRRIFIGLGPNGRVGANAARARLRTPNTARNCLIYRLPGSISAQAHRRNPNASKSSQRKPAAGPLEAIPQCLAATPFSRHCCVTLSRLTSHRTLR